MGLFRKFGDILSANLNDLVERFEDPEKMLRQAIREMDEAVASALNSAAKVIANEKLLARQLADTQQQAGHWHDRARQAVQDGDDALARRALVRKAEHEQLLPALEDQQVTSQQTSRKLRRQIDGMRSKLAEAKRKLATLCARNRAVEARRKLLAISTAASPEAAFSRFDNLCERVELAEAETDALVDLGVLQSEDETLEEVFDERIDLQLAELKREATNSAE
jgi:phage shock protein A